MQPQPATDGRSSERPTRVARQDRSRRRVEAILSAAQDLLREGGVERCTMAALAARAELTPSSVYRYFPDAGAVLCALAAESLQRSHEGLAARLSKIDSVDGARTALHRAVRDYHQAFGEDRALLELWTGAYATRELAELNINDSRRNGDLIAERIGPWSPLDAATLRTRCFLLSQLTGATIALVLETTPADARRLLREFDALIDTVFEPPARPA